MKTLIRQSDKIGVLSSFLCLAHCLFVPVLLSMQPLTVHLDTHTSGHALELLFLLVSFVAVFFSTRHISSKAMKLAFYAVLGLFIVGFVFEESFYWTKYLGYLGSLGLIVLHLYNWKKSQGTCARA